MYNEYKYKDVAPDESIKIFKKILQDYGIQLTEHWLPKSSIDTYSVRVTIEGTEIGTNGKGVSRDLALASAYGEFFERWQNKYLKIEYSRISTKYCYFADEKQLSTEELVMQNDPVTRMILNEYKDASFEEKVQIFNERMIFYESKGGYLCVPYMNLYAEKIQYIPLFFCRNIYGSNGMCAGNSKYEALTQGLSEILERNAILQVLDGRNFPEIKEELILSDHNLSIIYNKIDKNRIKVIFKNCSMTDGCYVICGIFIDKMRGTYGVNFGAHPDFRIAISRVLTEATQGQDIYKFSVNSNLNFKNENVNKLFNIYNIHSVSRGEYPFEFIVNRYNGDNENVRELKYDEMGDNQEQFNRIIDAIHLQGKEVLVRDVGITSVPAFHIVIPTFSELSFYSNEYQKLINTKVYVDNLLRKTSQIDETDIKYMEYVIEHFINYLSCQQLNSFYSRRDGYRYFLEEEKLDAIFVLALCKMALGHFKDAWNILVMISKRVDDSKVEKNKIIYYLLGYNQLREQYSIKECIEILNNVYEPVPNILNNLTSDNIINRFIPDETVFNEENIPLLAQLYNSDYIDSELERREANDEEVYKN